MRFIILLNLLLLFISDAAIAADISTILANVRGIIVPLTTLVLMICFIGGGIMIFHALTMFKKLGGVGNSMQSQPGEIGKPLLYLIVGSMLVYLPTSTGVLLNSIFESGQTIFSGSTVNYQAMGQGATLLQYGSSSSVVQQWADFANTLVLFIQFGGFLSFVKGWFIISHAGGQGAQQGSIARGITHIVAGLILINFVGMTTIIANTIFGTG